MIKFPLGAIFYIAINEQVDDTPILGAEMDRHVFDCIPTTQCTVCRDTHAVVTGFKAPVVRGAL